MNIHQVLNLTDSTARRGVGSGGSVGRLERKYCISSRRRRGQAEGVTAGLWRRDIVREAFHFDALAESAGIVIMFLFFTS